MRYYSLRKILQHNATYNVIFGERSNGKSYAVHKYGLEEFWKNGSQMAVIRRWQDDYTGKRGSTMFDGIVNNGEVTDMYCSCPYALDGKNCKHMAAVLYEWSEDAGEEEPAKKVNTELFQPAYTINA